ncbi:hypothetical protein RSAG8_01976, partial [Rhizoctonia solani AG-8 WAC10335]
MWRGEPTASRRYSKLLLQHRLVHHMLMYLLVRDREVRSSRSLVLTANGIANGLVLGLLCSRLVRLVSLAQTLLGIIHSYLELTLILFTLLSTTQCVIDSAHDTTSATTLLVLILRLSLTESTTSSLVVYIHSWLEVVTSSVFERGYWYDHFATFGAKQDFAVCSGLPVNWGEDLE